MFRRSRLHNVPPSAFSQVLYRSGTLLNAFGACAWFCSSGDRTTFLRLFSTDVCERRSNCGDGVSAN